MPRPRTALLPLLAALPALLVAGLGLLHPVFLTPETAERWRLAHLLLLPAFPLVAASVWFVLRRVRGAAAWVARVLASAYAVLYGALDAIAGVGAPHQVLRADERGEPGPNLGDVYEIGDRLGDLGVYTLAAALLVTGGVMWLRDRSPYALAGAVVGAASCWPFLQHHVFPPRGVLALVGIAAALALLELSRQRESSANSSPGP
ncbi:MAG: hypothetical protein JWM62_1713 [Frankiales bacterium]|nr:hypothetical protein [Frankiales bacterium]